VSDRQVRFSGDCWQEIEALPQPVRWSDALGVDALVVYLGWQALLTMVFV
jgi:hypothetical protein